MKKLHPHAPPWTRAKRAVVCTLWLLATTWTMASCADDGTLPSATPDADVTDLDTTDATDIRDIDDTTEPTDADTDADTGDATDADTDPDASPDPDEPNACGGTARLDGEPGDACGPCDRDWIICEGEDLLRCSGETACSDVDLHVLDVIITGDGDDRMLRIDGELTGLPALPSEAGACVMRTSIASPVFVSELCTASTPTVIMDGFAELSVTRELPAAGAPNLVFVYALLEGDDLDDAIFSRPVAFTRELTAPETFTVTGRDDGILLTWDPVDDAEYYVVWRDGEVAFESMTTTEVLDVEVPFGRLTMGTATATQGTRADGVRLTITGTAVAAGSSVSYRVAAAGAEGDRSPRSAPQSGATRAYEPTDFVWERARRVTTVERSKRDDDSDREVVFDRRGDLIGREVIDTQAPVDGERLEYRASLRFDGAWSTSSVVEGWRGGGTAPSVRTLADIHTPSVRLEATVRGVVETLGEPAVVEHGFCIASSDTPSFTNGSCVMLGAPTEGETFTHTFGGLSPIGTLYVRAFGTTGVGQTWWGAARSITGVPDAVESLTASDGTSSEHVLVSWAAVEGATSYVITRDGVHLAEVEELSYSDTSAPAGGIPPAISELSASQDNPAHVTLSWAPVLGTPGSTALYRVQARNTRGMGAPAFDTGYRAPFPIEGYVITPGLRAAVTVSGDATTWTDELATPPTFSFNPADISASSGTSNRYIDLAVDARVNRGNPVAYRVYAVSAAGGGAQSESVSGRRASGTLSVSWFRRPNRDTDWAAYPTIRGVAPQDDVGPDQRYFYYATVYHRWGTDIVASVDSQSVEGTTVRNLPEVQTNEPVVVGPGEVTFSGEVLSTNTASPRGFCWSMSPTPRLPAGGGTSCATMANSSATFNHTVSGLEPGETWFVAAWYDHGAFPVYGQTFAFSTPYPVPTAPQNVRMVFENPDNVVIAWDPVADATHYRVYRVSSDSPPSSGAVTMQADDWYLPVWVDEDAPSPSISAIASMERLLTHPDGDPPLEEMALMRVDGARPTSGSARYYFVEAVGPGGVSPMSASALGRRVAPEIPRYELQRSDGSWEPIPASRIERVNDNRVLIRLFRDELDPAHINLTCSSSGRFTRIYVSCTIESSITQPGYRFRASAGSSTTSPSGSISIRFARYQPATDPEPQIVTRMRTTIGGTSVWAYADAQLTWVEPVPTVWARHFNGYIYGGNEDGSEEDYRVCATIPDHAPTCVEFSQSRLLGPPDYRIDWAGSLVSARTDMHPWIELGLITEAVGNPAADEIGVCVSNPTWQCTPTLPPDQQTVYGPAGASRIYWGWVTPGNGATFAPYYEIGGVRTILTNRQQYFIYEP